MKIICCQDSTGTVVHAAQQADGSFSKCDIAADLARASLDAEGRIHRIAKGGKVAL